MARSAIISSPADASATQHRTSLSPSPAASFSSDKENQTSGRSASRQTKGKGRASAMGPPKLPTPVSDSANTPRTNKRRKLGEHNAPLASQVAYQREMEEVADAAFYDPDQSMEQRRAIRKELRDLTRDLNDSRAEYLAADSKGLMETVDKANEIINNVKQTSDATLDSRLLVSAADLSYKKTAQLALGDAAAGVDVDEFVSKCISFMRRGPSGDSADGGSAPSSSRQRRRQTGRADVDDDSAAEGSGDEGDALNWEWLGRRACFPHNRRPPVPGFLLGPLSVQKRTRVQKPRRERLQRRNPADVIRPEELKASDIEKVESSNLTTLCRNIREALVKTQTEGQQKVEEEATEDMSDDEVRALMARHGISDDGGVGLFRFAINPKSFGQTVENFFYITFLLKEGTVGIGMDTNKLPTLHSSVARNAAEIKEQNVQKYQAVFKIEEWMWEELIDAFDITESMIPDRKSAESAQVSATGWYG
ncbi:MAG: nuclear protein [Candelina submexicana]|nr:MAG: nuclear protein [Candelina submexicana]